MKTMAPYAFSALVLGGLAALFAAAGTLEREIAAAQTDLAIANLTAADTRRSGSGSARTTGFRGPLPAPELKSKPNEVRSGTGAATTRPSSPTIRTPRTRDFGRTSR